MSFTISPDSPKAAQAAAFGAELVKACAARGVPLNELERAAGVGHSSLDNYRRGLLLPKLEKAVALAEALDWPKLRTMVERFRTATCARAGCGRRFRNEGGGPKRYCSSMCQRIAESLRIASRRARQAGQAEAAGRSAGKRRADQRRQLLSAVRIADERAEVQGLAIDAMCRGCEPEGACRTPDCPLRPFSPLPLAQRDATVARTVREIRSRSWTPERRERFRESLTRRWARPGEREAFSARMREWHASRTPEEREAWRRKVGLAQMDPSRRSAIAAKGAATKRERAEREAEAVS